MDEKTKKLRIHLTKIKKKKGVKFLFTRTTHHNQAKWGGWYLGKIKIKKQMGRMMW
jgi:hypothetical protein